MIPDKAIAKLAAYSAKNHGYHIVPFFIKTDGNWSHVVTNEDPFLANKSSYELPIVSQRNIATYGNYDNYDKTKFIIPLAQRNYDIPIKIHARCRLVIPSTGSANYRGLYVGVHNYDTGSDNILERTYYTPQPPSAQPSSVPDIRVDMECNYTFFSDIDAKSNIGIFLMLMMRENDTIVNAQLGCELLYVGN